MAFTETTQDPTDEKLVTLSGQIGRLLGKFPRQDPIESAGLAESFVIWEIGPEQLASRPPTLPTRPTPDRHYQIILNGKPAGFVVARQTESSWEIRQLAISALAEAIDQVIKRIDSSHQENTPVRFLVAPLCYVYAFELVHNDVVYVISAPPSSELPEKKRLNPGMILSTSEFLDRLKWLFETTVSDQ